MTAAVVLGALALLAYASNGSKAKGSSKPPALPKPLGKPPATVTPIRPKLVVPGSPPAGVPVPGAKPGAKPPALATPAQLKAKPPAPKKPAPAAKAKVVAPAKKKPLAKPSAKTAPAGNPAGGVPASPELEPNHGLLPAGYAPVTARTRARAMAAHLAKKGPANYSRDELKSWQRQAGLSADGMYGGSSRGALIFYGVKDPPRPFFKPVATLPYVPPEQRK